MSEQNSKRYANASQQRLLAVIEAMTMDPLRAWTVGDIARAVRCENDQAMRTLHNLALGSWATREGDGWRISPEVTRFAERLRQATAAVLKHYLETPEENNPHEQED